MDNFRASFLAVLSVLMTTFFFIPSSAKAASAKASASAACANLSSAYQGAWDVNSDPIDGKWSESKKALRSVESDIYECSPGPARDYAAGYIYALKAAVEYHAGDPWKTDMNLALQLLEKCVTRYYGTEKSAQCQTDIETNIHRKVQWERAE